MSSFRWLIIVFSAALISRIGSCVVHVIHTHTLTDIRALRWIALRQIPGGHFYGLLRASAHTHTHTHDWPAGVCVVCTGAVNRTVKQCNCFAAVNPLPATSDSLWFCYELKPVYTLSSAARV